MWSMMGTQGSLLWWRPTMSYWTKLSTGAIIGAIGGAMICGTFWSFLGLLLPPPVLLDVREDSLAELVLSLQCVLWGILYGAVPGAIIGAVARFDHVMRFGDGMMGSGALIGACGGLLVNIVLNYSDFRETERILVNANVEWHWKCNLSDALYGNPHVMIHPRETMCRLIVLVGLTFTMCKLRKIHRLLWKLYLACPGS